MPPPHNELDAMAGPEGEQLEIEGLIGRIQPRRRITGMSAVLLPFTDSGEISWGELTTQVERTARAGLVPAVNMDTGYVQLLDTTTRERVLDVARAHAGGRFVAGAQVADAPGSALDLDGYRRAIDAIQERGGMPIVFPSYGLAAVDGSDWVEAHASLGKGASQLLAFELGPMFVPYGRIYDLETYRALLSVKAVIGAKHSSLSRAAEWERLALRDSLRPDFKVLTGNDLAIDMVMYGSDYLLGLSTFAPDLFAERDRYWERGDARFFELNDALQALGTFTFREPVPGYRHDAAIFLELRGWISSGEPHPEAPRRPDADREVLSALARHLGVLADR